MDKKMAKVNLLVARIFSRGVVDLFRRPRAAVDYWRRIAVAAMSAAASELREALRLPTCTFETIVPSADSIPVTLVEYRYAYGDMPVHELITLCRLVRYREPKVIFEIGTYVGGTTLQLAANSQAELYTLDLPTVGQDEYASPRIWEPDLDVYPDNPGTRFHGTPYAERVYQLFGDSRTYDFAPYYGRVDFVFVDGCHHYEFVLRDSQNALKMMSPNGVVIWHDYASYAPGVVQALNEVSKVVPLVHIAGTSLVIHHRGA